MLSPVTCVTECRVDEPLAPRGDENTQNLFHQFGVILDLSKEIPHQFVVAPADVGTVGTVVTAPGKFAVILLTLLTRRVHPRSNPTAGMGAAPMA
jgi:hypothetical protein